MFILFLIIESPNFIESLTSESNIGMVEHGDAVLKCFAIGKPAPKIRWYRIEDNNGLIRGSTSFFSIRLLLLYTSYNFYQVKQEQHQQKVGPTLLITIIINQLLSLY